MCGTGTRKSEKDQKYLKLSEIWSWRKMQKIIWTDHVRNEKVLQRVKEERNILHRIKEETLTELVTYCVGTAFSNTLLKERWKR